MIFATIETPLAKPIPALVSNGRVHPLPFIDMHEVIQAGAVEAARRASEACELQSGDVIGSGTVGTGCLLELTKAQGPWLQAGSVVELEIERIGILKNTIGGKKA